METNIAVIMVLYEYILTSSVDLPISITLVIDVNAQITRVNNDVIKIQLCVLIIKLMK